MQGALGVVIALVWLAAVYSFIRVALAWLQVLRVAPAGQRTSTAIALGFWDFDRVARIAGAGSHAPIAVYRRGFTLFFACVAVLFTIAMLMILTGGEAA